MARASLRSALVAVLLLGLACHRSGPERRSALLITLDTTRADALGCYGGPRVLTPNIDRLAAEGTLFEHAYAVAPLTLPSHTSMMTGLWPPVHGERENGLRPLTPAAVTVAERARAAGWQTAAFVAALVLDASFGLDQGFETYQGPPRERGSSSSHVNELPGKVVVDRALAWLGARDRERPFFLWVHLFEPHGPYDPPPGFRPDDTSDPRKMYLGEIAAADAQIGRLIDGLREEGVLDDTFVAFVADHGEAFGEHGEPTHGAFVWDTTLHVPLVLRCPPLVAAGARSDAIASVADLHPTLVAAMGLPPTPGVDGLSLLAPPDPGRGVYFESYSGYLSYGWSPLAGWRDARGKYVHSSRPQLFDPARDPGEEHDLLADGPLPERTRPYEEALAAVGALAPLPAGDAQGATDPSLLQGIRALGYAGVGDASAQLPAPLDPSDRPAPQDCVTVYREGLRAQELSNRGDYAGAVTALMPLVREQPDNPFVLDRLSTALIRLDRPKDALPFLERLVRIGPGWPGSFCNLGLACYRVGRTDDAVTNLEKAIRLDPTQDFFWDALLEVLEKSGRTDELARWRAERAQHDAAAPDDSAGEH